MKYQLTVTEEQLLLVARCVEDCCRFASGQMGLDNTASISLNCCEIREILEQAKPFMTPDLPHNASYGWSGGSCKNDGQRKFIAQTYAIYREIYHKVALARKVDNVYTSETLTCEEGGELPIIEPIEK